MTDSPIRQQVMKYLAEQFPGATLADHQLGADGLLAIFEAEAARVRAEAVAERAEIVAVIEQYLPEALPFNSLSEIVGGIARQRDFQHELKDHLAEVARRLTDGRDAAVAGAVADERQRIAAGLEAAKPHIPPPADPKRRESIIVRSTLNKALRIVAAGSVPVATPPAEPAAEQLLRDVFMDPDRVATPTEPWCEQHGRAHCSICIARMAAAASPVPAEQPEGR